MLAGLDDNPCSPSGHIVPVIVDCTVPVIVLKTVTDCTSDCFKNILALQWRHQEVELSTF